MKILDRLLQKRSQGYTEQVLAAKAQAWSNSDTIVFQTAAVEFGLGAYSRAFSSARVSPGIEAVSREYLASVARDLLLTGNHLSVIDAEGGELVFRRSYSWDIRGDYRPSSWLYNVSLSGPTKSLTKIYRPQDVVHIRLNPPSNRPWAGISPLANSSLSANLLARIERALSEEMGGAVANLLSIPSTLTEQHAIALADRLATAQGNIVIQQGGADSWVSNTKVGGIALTRIGADPPEAIINLRDHSEASILSAMGVPSGLYAPKEGAVSREAYRQFVYGSVIPMGKLISEELTTKLGQDIALNFESAAAADVAARARAYHILTEAQMPEDQILELIGYD